MKRGDPLSQPLEEHPVFPPMVVQMMAVGEETGALDEMLDKIADFYDQEVEATVDALTSLIEPILIVVMGVVRRRHDHLALPADVQHHQAHQVTRVGRREQSRRSCSDVASSATPIFRCARTTFEESSVVSRVFRRLPIRDLIGVHSP